MMNDIIDRIALMLLRDDDLHAFLNIVIVNKDAHTRLKKYTETYNMTTNADLIQLKYDIISATFVDEPKEDVLVQGLSNIVGRIKRMSGVNLNNFKASHADTIRDIQLELQTYLRQHVFKNARLIEELIKCRDVLASPRFFGPPPIANPARMVTSVFNEFVKGVTYFRHEGLNGRDEPVYHRHGACPPKRQANISCDAHTPEDEKQALQKCYIERLIYDEIFHTCTQCQQDKGHLEWLENTKKAWQRCFPGHSLEVKLRFHDVVSSHPIIAMLEIHGPNNDMIREVYTKKYDEAANKYEDSVECIRQVNKQIQMKRSSFDVPSTWQTISGLAPVPRIGAGSQKGRKRSTRV